MLSFCYDFVLEDQVCFINDGDLKMVGFILDDGRVCIGNHTFSIQDLSDVVSRAKMLKHE